MKVNTLDIITPIKLLRGSHPDTAETGQGCFMNVVAYLNGESQITDQSPCVCVTVRSVAVVMNDRANDEQRQRMLPLVLRAMGSATEDKAILGAQRAELRKYNDECQELVKKWRAEMKAADADADAYANTYANTHASANADAYANAYDNVYAYTYADAYASAYYTHTNADADADPKRRVWVYGQRDELCDALFDAGLRYLDAVLPPADAPSGAVMGRAAKLCELATA